MATKVKGGIEEKKWKQMSDTSLQRSSSVALMTSPPQAQDLHGGGQELQRQERTAGKEGEVTAAESPSPMRRRDGSKRSEGRARLELALRRAARG